MIIALAAISFSSPPQSFARPFGQPPVTNKNTTVIHANYRKSFTIKFLSQWDIIITSMFRQNILFILKFPINITIFS